jgi:hypothetical protein
VVYVKKLRFFIRKKRKMSFLKSSKDYIKFLDVKFLDQQLKSKTFGFSGEQQKLNFELLTWLLVNLRDGINVVSPSNKHENVVTSFKVVLTSQK